VIEPRPVTLEGHGVRLEPLTVAHGDDLIAAASDGRLWELWFTSVPQPDETGAYVAAALEGQAAGHMLPWAVRDLASGAVVGTTRYHDIVAPIDRVEIGYTWYAAHTQRSHVNTTCKLLLLGHAFETLECIAVEFRTHRLNTQSRRAIERLGAQLDGILRAHARAADGSLRDTAVYSITAFEWPAVRAHLDWQLAKPR
jgi:RimJ/RimL family protein N-acetyltransferase